MSPTVPTQDLHCYRQHSDRRSRQFHGRYIGVAAGRSDWGMLLAPRSNEAYIS